METKILLEDKYLQKQYMYEQNENDTKGYIFMSFQFFTCLEKKHNNSKQKNQKNDMI